MSVLIAHPTRQHAHRLAAALFESNLLQGFFTLLPDPRKYSPALRRLLPPAILRNPVMGVPHELVHSFVGPLAFQKIGAKSHFTSARQLGELASWSIFDRWVAGNLKRLRPKVVVGYEMCSEQTFSAAKSLGIRCVLDAAATHYSLQEKVLGEEITGTNSWAGRGLQRRKLLEIETADLIICVSDLGKQSYVEAGVSESRILVNQIGCDTAQFTGPPNRNGRTKFVFVGQTGKHKGIDLLFSAFNELAQGEDIELHIVGDPAGLPHSRSDRIFVYGKKSHAQLCDILRRMDCLVLPSRLESFGMVVPEALAAGSHVIVSDHAGAAEAVIPNVNGWVFPTGDLAALIRYMRECSRNVERVRQAADVCSSSASAYDWSSYSVRSRGIFAKLCS